MPVGLTNIAAIAASENDGSSLFLLTDGSVRHWQEGRFPSKPDLNDAIAISIGAFNALALRSNGTVAGWGDDYFFETIVPANLTGVVAIATGNRQSLALKSDGTVVMWGQHGTEVPAYVQNIVAISAGKAENYFHALGLKNDGTVVAWGRHDYGEGNIPSGLTNVVAVSAGYFHNLALKADGTVVGWGGKDAQVITPPPGLSNVTAISAADWHNVALKSDGSIATWDGQQAPFWWHEFSVPAGLTNVHAISAGRGYTLGLIGDQAPVIVMQPQAFTVPWHTPTGNGIKVIGTDPLFYQWRKDGVDIPLATNSTLSFSYVDFGDTAQYTVYVSNYLGSVTSDPATMTVTPWIDILEQPISRSVFAGDDVIFFVTAVGSPHTYQWRRNGFDIPGATEEALYLTNVQTEAGIYSVVIRSHGLEISSAGAVLTINGNVLPAIVAPPRPETSFVGAKLVMGVTASGTPPLFYQWQRDGLDIVGETNPSLSFGSVQSSDAGTYRVRVSNSQGSVVSPDAPLTLVNRTIEFPPPGTVVSAGGPIVPPDLNDVVAIAAGTRHGLALKSDGTVAIWGGGLFPPLPGQPVDYVPPGLSNVVAIAAGNGHSVALKQDGTVVGWPEGGRNPAVPGNLFGVIAIAAGDAHALAVRADGTVVAWGDSPLPLNGLNNVVAVAAGGQRNIALREDGTALAWGLNVYQHVFAPLNGITAVAAGARHIMALRDDGKIFDYFDGSDPTNSAPSVLNGVTKIAAGERHSVALHGDGSVSGWNGANLPAGLANVSAISAGRGFTLLLTTNPPAPALAVEKVDESILLSAPISVSGYVLETTDDLSRPYQPIEETTSPKVAADGEKTAFTLPASPRKFYRFRKL
jgi:alpha-tubulin suppressor-like RCC1 family protein